MGTSFQKNRIYILFIFIPIFLNYALNLKDNLDVELILSINFYDILLTVLLFIFLIYTGKEISYKLNLPYISTGIVAYALSFFLFDIILLFITTKLSFSNIFIIVNFLWIFSLVLLQSEKVIILRIIIFYGLLNGYSKLTQNLLTVNKNIIGDVKDIHFDHVKNIYTESYYYSVSNSGYEGYPQLVAYFQALLNKISTIEIDFLNYSSTINVLFLLTLLFIFELDLHKINKLSFAALFTALTFNSEWLKILFFDSLMTEGTLSYLFCVLTVSIVKSTNEKGSNKLLIFVLIGILYFSKQFISLLSLVVIIFFLLNKKIRPYAWVGFFGLLLKEVSYISYFSKVTKNFHLVEVDLIDTFFDLLLLRDLKLENVKIIFQNLAIDIPLTLILIYLVILSIFYLIMNGTKDKDFNLYTLLITINFLLVFILYVSIWRDAELESPIRYMLNLLHLVLFSQFKIIDNYIKKEI